MQSRLEITKQIAREAGQLLREGQEKGFSLVRKSTEIDLVTEYDQMAEALIVKKLQEAFPDHGIVAEEGSSVKTEADGLRWYVDPLDGTNNFAHRIPQFGVSMGLYQGPTPVLAVVYDPMRDHMYWAEEGSGAYLNGEPMKVSQATTVQDSILASGFPYDRHSDPVDNIAQMGLFLKRCQGFRRFGACCLDLASVAAGRYDGFWEFKLSSWDVGAGLLLVTEAGGKVTRIDGSPMSYLTERNNIVVSNGHIHQEMLDILKPSLTEKHLYTGEPVF